MLIEAFCKTGICPRWDINTLIVCLHPECPTCKGYETFWRTDEVNDAPENMIKENEDE